MTQFTSSQVVIQLLGRPIKGHLLDDLATVRTERPEGDLKVVKLRLLETGEEIEVPLAEAKAVFFVKTFAGELNHSDLRFYDGSTPNEYLWVRLTFVDGEVLEGMIQNSSAFILSEGIWITPTDPTGNNWLVYALKSQLRQFEVLGLRQHLNKQLRQPLG
jgi:hypothetical protein